MVSASLNLQPLADVSNALAEAVGQLAPAVVAVLANRLGPASGVLWRPGVVVTCAHAIRREDGIRVILADGARMDAALAGIDASTDLAVLKVEGAGAGVEAGDQERLRPGHLVFSVARDASGQAAASFGIIAATAGEWRTWRGGRIDRLIRLDGGLRAGFSGGAVANVAGEVVGIGTAGLTRGYAIVVPASTVNRVTDTLLATGRITRGYLGIGTRPIALPESLSRKLGLADPAGLIVLTLAPQGPAEAGGLLLGDILLDLDGQRVRDVADLYAALPGERIGEPMRLGLIRGGERIESSIMVGERPRRGC